MDLIKKLTSKNKQDYEMAASHILDNCDVKAFEELVSKDDFLFDFIKSNVATRLSHAVNKSNYKSLLKFLPFYSSSYVDVIAESLAKFADEDLTDAMLELFENGSDNEKAYCARFFAFVKDSLALELLRKHAFSDFEPLAYNSAATLSAFGDRECFNKAVEDLNSGDDYAKLDAVKFLAAFNDKAALEHIFKALKTSSFAEHIAIEIPYMVSILELLNSDSDNALYVLNLIVNGLGEVSSLAQVFDFQLYEVFESLMNNLNQKSACVLLNALNKFDILTENDEYLYDEDKNTKTEVSEIKNLLSNLDKTQLIELAKQEMVETSDFVFDLVDLIKDEEKLVSLTKSSNPTLVLKSMTALKSMGKLDLVSKDEILNKIDNENIKAVILAL